MKYESGVLRAKTEILEKKVPFPLYSPQIPHGLAWY
jgi:hypothetical protein